jgi:hypothetical protein
MTTAFSDLPREQRVAAHKAVATAGGLAVGYNGVFMQVVAPNPAPPFFAALKRHGLALDSSEYVPLDGDNPPDDLRHDGDRPDSRDYWLYANLRPVALKAAKATPVADTAKATSQGGDRA